LAAFWMVAAFIGFLALVTGLVVFDLDFAWLAARWRIFQSFIDLDDPYGMLSMLFGPSGLHIVPALLGLGVSSLALLLFPRTGARDDLYDANLAAVVWSVGMLVLMSVVDHYPFRYQIHILVPLALCTAYGITRLERVGLSGIAAAFSASTGVRGAAALVVLVLPTAVLVAAVGAGIIGLMGVPSHRLIIQLPLVAMFTLVLCLIMRRSLARPPVLGIFLAIPVAGSLAWFLIWVLRPGAVGFWPSTPSVAETEIRALLTVAAIALAVLAMKWRERSPSAPLVCFAVAWLALSAIHIAPGVIQPRFTLRDASIDLGRTFAHASSIGSHVIQGIFLDNTLAYKSDWGESEEDPAEIVVALQREGTPEYSDLGYKVVKTYDIYHAKLYATRPPGQRPDLCPEQKGICVVVYQRTNP